MAGRTPPRYVPTLTEVVKGGPAAAPAQPVAQEQLIQRVMQKIDLTLERRLREVIAAKVLEQTRGLGPALRDEIEAMVRQAVEQAFQEETAPTKKK
ncbi:hypothetical protein GCM10027034_06210 [Ramlibacter solisilvae]|uniref:Uncharacterized protein n=1 Tax=Ramlibacter tataouinensis TaxID=94132 RepID=A0A127JYF6_9BURK|nr:hypothetical protein [Ramlibacter tataouinensis]AMO24969.1 hypothetical protein UC35_21710 [Ramlibacter tataouinensis]